MKILLAIVASLVSLLGGLPPARPIVPPAQPDPCMVLLDREHKLLRAIWKDGTMLCRSSLFDTSSDLLVTETDPASVTAALKTIADCGFSASKQPGGKPDSPTAKIIVRQDPAAPATKRDWDESLHFWRFVEQPNEQVVAFVPVWLKVHAAILSVPPKSAKSLTPCLDKNGLFRGFNPVNPHDTGWFW